MTQSCQTRPPWYAHTILCCCHCNRQGRLARRGGWHGRVPHPCYRVGVIEPLGSENPERAWVGGNKGLIRPYRPDRSVKTARDADNDRRQHYQLLPPPAVRQYRQRGKRRELQLQQAVTYGCDITQGIEANPSSWHMRLPAPGCPTEFKDLCYT